MSAWIGVDLDGTLAEYHGWEGATTIGEPIPAMVERVKRWIAEGQQVRVFTARVHPPQHPSAAWMDFTVVMAIQNWCKEHIGQVLRVTCVKDFEMLELWDDRAVQVEANTGRALGHSTRGLDGPRYINGG